jgi:hypothetical protein
MPLPLLSCRDKFAMRRIVAALIVVTLIADSDDGQVKLKRHPGLRKSVDASSSTADLNMNRIYISLDNVGGLNQYPVNASYTNSTWDGWNFGPSYFGTDMIFDHQFWVAGKRGNAIGCLTTSWNSPYSPGPVIGGKPAMKVRPQDSTRYKIYLVTRGDTSTTNPDYVKWPSDLGAPTAANGTPKISGDQTAWMVYNGADTTIFPQFFRRRLPQRALLPVDIHETVFEHFGEPNDTSIWANALFFEWAIYNKGSDPIDSMFLAFWTDIDFIDPSFTIPAVDTVAQAGYCWYGLDSSAGCVAYVLLDGPSVPSPGGMATYFGKPKPGARNLPLNSFWGIEDDSYPDSSSFGPPYSDGTSWNVIRGLSQRGTPIIDSTTHLPTKFPWSGDPITRTGSMWPYRGTGGGGGFIITTGGFTLAPGDSQWMMVAVMPTAKWNGIDAVNRMRMNSAYLRSLPYDSLVSHKPRRTIAVNPLPAFGVSTTFALHQNYPNPFNNQTLIPFDLPERSMIKVEVFDILGRSVAVLPEQEMQRGSQTAAWYSTSSSGIYFVRVRATSLETGHSWSGVSKAILLK